METIAVVLSVGDAQAEAFESGFHAHEIPVWRELESGGLLVAATLNRLDITSRPVEGATQYLIVAIFATREGHNAHDEHPGFKSWNEIADTYQVAPAMAFGGETIERLGVSA